MWSYGGSVSFVAKTNASDATRDKIAGAATREQLNAVWVRPGTLVVLSGDAGTGAVKMAYKVWQIVPASHCSPYSLSAAIISTAQCDLTLLTT